MDKLIFNIAEDTVSREGMVVRIDAEAAAMVLDIAGKTRMDKNI